MPPKKGAPDNKIQAERAKNLKSLEDGGTSAKEYRILQFLQVGDFFLCFIFMLSNIPRYNDDQMTDAPPNYYNVIAFQLFCSLVAWGFSITSIIVLHKSFQSPNWSGVVQCVVLKVVCLFMDFVQTAYPGSALRSALGVALWILHACLIVALPYFSAAAGIQAKSAKGTKKVPALMKALARIKTDKPITVYTAEILEQWLNPSANKKKKATFTLGSEHFTYLSFFVMFMVFGNFYTEFNKLSGATDPKLPITGQEMSIHSVYTDSGLDAYWCSSGTRKLKATEETTYAYDYSTACKTLGSASPDFVAAVGTVPANADPCPNIGKAFPAATAGDEALGNVGCTCSVRNLLPSCNRTKANAQQRVRVVLVTIDGLRADYGDPATSPNVAWKTLIGPEYDAGFLYYKQINAMLPTKTAPGWQSMITGTEPEIHGMLGDAKSTELYFDSIFNQAHLEGMFAGISGTSWVAQMVRSKLPGLGGDSTIPPGWKNEKGGDDTQFGGKDGVHAAHVLRANVAATAIKTREALDYNTGGNIDPTPPLIPLYDLLMAQFSVVDTAGHQNMAVHGTSLLPRPEISVPEHIYQLAVNNASAALAGIFAEAKRTDQTSKTKTIVVVTSSHGVDDVGLNGGVTLLERKVPLLVYSHNGGAAWAAKTELSDVGKANVAKLPPMHKGDECTECPEAYINDIAPTLSVMLGLPIPRQNQGRIIKEALGPITFDDDSLVEMHYNDHYSQYHTFVKAYLKNADYVLSASRFPEAATYKDANMATTLPADTCEAHAEVCDYITGDQKNFVNARAALNARGIVDGAKGLLVEFHSKRKSDIDFQVIRNYAIAISIFVFLMVMTVLVLQSTTYADLLKPSKKDNRAITFALIWVFLYYGVCVLSYWLFFFSWGFQCQGQSLMIDKPYEDCVEWGAHHVHSRSMWYTKFLPAVMFPGMIMSYIIHRSYKYMFSKPPYTPFSNKEENCKKRMKQCTLMCYSGDSQPSDLALIYLIKLYIMFFSILGAGVSLVCLSEFSFLMPFVYRIRNLSVMDEESIAFWDVRFRIICVVGMSLPLQWANLLVAMQWKGQNITKESYEQLFRLKQDKDARNASGSDQEKAQASAESKKDGDQNDNLLLKNLDILDEELGSGPTVGTKATIEDLNKQVEEMKVERELIIQRAKEQLQQAEAEKDLFAKRCQQDILQARAEMDVYKEKERTLTSDLIALKADHIENQNKFKAIKERDVAQAHAGKEKLLAKVFQTEAELKRVEAERAQLRNDLAAIAREQNADKVLERATRNLEEQLDQAKATKDQLLVRVETLQNELREAKVEKAQIQKQAEADKATMQKLLKEFENRLGTAESMFDQWKGASR